jgi:hypothetical protein
MAKIKQKQKTAVKKKSSSMITDVIIMNPLDDAREGIGTTLKLITSALTLVSALAWNEAIKGLFDTLSKSVKEIATLGQFGYAVLITFVTVFIINRLEKIKARVEKEKDK